jgi:uncharacterized protein YjiS (DUF1127 family)
MRRSGADADATTEIVMSLMALIQRTFVLTSQAFLSFVIEARQRRTIRELQALDNRTLADIGITRGEIEHAVRGPRPVR